MAYSPGPNEVETYSGRFVDVSAPDPETLNLVDIAHALSQTCRYGGHCDPYYCNTPETLVLTADLRWVSAGDLRLGDELLALDEYPALDGIRPRRKGRGAIVTHVGSILREIVRLDLEDGRSVRASAEHPWLVAFKNAGNQRWQSALSLLGDVRRGSDRFLVQYAEPWTSDSGYAAGYLAGILDGEGHVRKAGNGLGSLGVGQNPGPVLDAIVAGLTSRGVKFSARQNPQSSCINVDILGSWADRAALLGRLRPLRLIENVRASIMSDSGSELPARARVKIIGGEIEGPGEVTALSTSTRTYLADGFAAHNSVAEHAVFVSKRLERRGEPRYLQLAGLHHDDSEAYLGDIPRPLKPLLGIEYERLTNLMDSAICEALELPFLRGTFHDEGVKEADNWALLVEARYLLPSQGRGWTSVRPGADNQPSKIITPDYWTGGLSPNRAYKAYLARHRELTCS